MASVLNCCAPALPGSVNEGRRFGHNTAPMDGSCSSSSALLSWTGSISGGSLIPVPFRATPQSSTAFRYGKVLEGRIMCYVLSLLSVEQEFICNNWLLWTNP